MFIMGWWAYGNRSLLIPLPPDTLPTTKPASGLPGTSSRPTIQYHPGWGQRRQGTDTGHNDQGKGRTRRREAERRIPRVEGDACSSLTEASTYLFDDGGLGQLGGVRLRLSIQCVIYSGRCICSVCIHIARLEELSHLTPPSKVLQGEDKRMSEHHSIHRPADGQSLTRHAKSLKWRLNPAWQKVEVALRQTIASTWPPHHQ